MADLRIGIMGVEGRMGRLLVEEVGRTPGCVLSGGTVEPGRSPVTLMDGLSSTDMETVFAGSDVVIDFTVPAATARHAVLAADSRTALVVGTTGLTPEAHAAIQVASARTPLLVAANTSVGVNLLMALVEQVAQKLDPAWDIEVLEMHHRHKVDAPSGTALALGEAAARGREVSLADVARRSRDGHTGARPAGEIGFATLRGGDVVGDHSVIFAGTGERLELTHRSADRRLYAAGALRAATWIAGRPPGRYAMKDVLGL